MSEYFLKIYFQNSNGAFYYLVRIFNLENVLDSLPQSKVKLWIQ